MKNYKKLYPKIYDKGINMGVNCYNKGYSELQCHNYYSYLLTKEDADNAMYHGIIEGYQNAEKEDFKVKTETYAKH